jgi:ATP-dependent helicase HrpB
MEPLPIDAILPKLTDHLKSAGAIVLKAEPGAGKTTRVPPAILDAGLADLQNKQPGQIVVLQPRRVAARAAAARMSDERGTALGGDIGYRVRHEGKSSKQTRILVCTEGIFLRRLQDDPLIENTAVVIFDEFHERSIDSDLALALTAQVRRDLRPDLRIVVMSATLDSAPISAFLGNCPAIESPGKTFPVSIDYLQFPSSDKMERLATEGVARVLAKTAGDVLVFLPGVGEIRETQSLIESSSAMRNLDVMPLYGEMPLPEQLAVLRRGERQKVVLATNVAETSLTINGITAVVDAGFARVNRFDPNVGINRLTLSRISKASAAQRAGRAGRTAPGQCLRLWTEREQMALAEFELPEIERVELSECILQLLAWGENHVHLFPWFEKPPSASIDNALELLDRLDAINGGKLTDLGKQMARFPLQPRLARLLIEGARAGQRERAALCAALLSERAPFRTNESIIPGSHHTDSDVLEQVRAIEAFDRDGLKDSIMGTIIPGAAKQVLRSSSQLLKLLNDSGLEADSGSNVASFSSSSDSNKRSPLKDADEAILRAIMSAYPDRICKRRQPKERRAVMVGGRGVTLSDQSNVFDAPLFAAIDLVDLNKSDLAVRRASGIERNWLPESHLSTTIDVEYDTNRQKVVAFKRTRFCGLILDENISSIPANVDPGEVLAEAVAANFDLTTLIDENSTSYLNRLLCLREWLPELELPEFGDEPWKTFLPALCFGSTSIEELKSKSMISAIQSCLNRDQLISLEKDAPEFFTLQSGRRVKLQYEPGKLPVLAARIQELFGMTETPRIARSRVGMTMHLLAPNYRIQQVTDDLSSFWKNTYPQVKKELKGRYPKHQWPDDPLKPIEPKSRKTQ